MDDSVGERRTVRVGHSGAGPLLGAAGDACVEVDGYVFVDAGLPTPGKSWFETVPAELAGQVQGMARDGWAATVVGVVESGKSSATSSGGHGQRRASSGEALPDLRAMFEEPLPPSPGWADRPGAYLRLSQAYQEPAEKARALGWPVIELDGDHLSVLTEPELVMEAVLDLVARLPLTAPADCPLTNGLRNGDRLLRDEPRFAPNSDLLGRPQGDRPANSVGPQRAARCALADPSLNRPVPSSVALLGRVIRTRSSRSRASLEIDRLRESVQATSDNQ